MEQWFVARGTDKQGPLTREKMKTAHERGEIRDTDLVWTEALGAWVPVGQAKERFNESPAGDLLGSLGIAGPSLDLDKPVLTGYKPSAVANSMQTGDRVLRALFVSVCVGLAWGIRGDFGHTLGAMYPGAVLALAFAYVTGQDSMFRWMPILGMASAVGIGIGGRMSYGVLHGYAQADTFVNYSYGFLTLFLQGGAWGCIGCAWMGLLLERKPLKAIEWLSAIAVAIVAGVFLYGLVYVVIGFDINPYRSNAMIGHFGAVLGLCAWMAWRKRYIGLRAAMLGFVGFGLGMSLGRLNGNIMHDLENYFQINHWNVMEVSVGLIGGFVFAFGMLGLRFPEPRKGARTTVLSVAGAVFCLGVIVLMHRLTRIEEGDIANWTQKLAEYGSSWTAGGISAALNAVVAFGFAGAGLWLYVHFTGKERFAWFPAIGLSLTMLLFQNFRALYFFYPRVENSVNMHSVFWVLFALAVGYVVFREYNEGHTDDADAEAELEPVPWRPWLAVAAAGFVLTVLLASVVNGETTMQSANTRWPIWAWRDGPFPGR